MGMEYFKSNLLIDKVYFCEDDIIVYVIGNSLDEVVVKFNCFFKEIYIWYILLEKLK